MNKRIIVIYAVLLLLKGLSMAEIAHAQRDLNPTDRVLYGEEVTDVNKYPWTVGLLQPGSSTPYCAGSIIDRDWIITTARCVENLNDRTELLKPNQIRVRSNSLPRATNTDSVFRNAKEIFTHPDYSSAGRIVYDVALIRVGRPFAREQIIPLNRDSHFPSAGDRLTAKSWIKLGDGNPDALLRDIIIPKMDRTLCDSLDNLGRIGDLLDWEYCGGSLDAPYTDETYNSIDRSISCEGVAGGPVVGWVNGEPRLVSMVRTGRPWCWITTFSYIFYYEKISAFQDWIDDVIQPEPKYLKCADENKICVLPAAGMRVYYGHAGRFVSKIVVGDRIGCNAKAVGGNEVSIDIVHREDRACYYYVDVHKYVSSEWKTCAAELGNCNFDGYGGRLLRFGLAPDRYVYKAFYGQTVDCKRSSFFYADTAYGRKDKHCQYLDLTSTPDTPPLDLENPSGIVPIECAGKGETCFLPNSTKKACYGIYGNYICRSPENPDDPYITCDTKTFFNSYAPSDPAYGIHKPCFFNFHVNKYTDDDWTFCANEGETCFNHQKNPRIYRYGKDGKWVYGTTKWHKTCSNVSFDVDPVSHLDKICEYISG